MTNISELRREYGNNLLTESTIAADPMVQFNQWFAEIQRTNSADPNAMVLSTVDESGFPDSRIVLLKGLEEERFVFYTNYESPKGKQLLHHPFAALNFYWPECARQVRIRGPVQRTSEEQSEAYFLSRPLLSQRSAIISPQSQPIPDRQFLEDALQALPADQARPVYWGGFYVQAIEIEFWQGRDNRLHDRFLFTKNEGHWSKNRLAP